MADVSFTAPLCVRVVQFSLPVPIMTWTRKEDMPEAFRQYWPEDCDGVTFCPAGTTLPPWLDTAFGAGDVAETETPDGIFYALLH